MQRRFRRAAIAAVFSFFLASFAHAAGIEVPAGATIGVNGGRLDFGGGSFRIDGYAGLGGGVLGGLDAVRIGAGGTADFSSGVATLTGDW